MIHPLYFDPSPTPHSYLVLRPSSLFAEVTRMRSNASYIMLSFNVHDCHSKEIDTVINFCFTFPFPYLAINPVYNNPFAKISDQIV